MRSAVAGEQIQKRDIRSQVLTADSLASEGDPAPCLATITIPRIDQNTFSTTSPHIVGIPLVCQKHLQEACGAILLAKEYGIVNTLQIDHAFATNQVRELANTALTNIHDYLNSACNVLHPKTEGYQPVFSIYLNTAGSKQLCVD